MHRQLSMLERRSNSAHSAALAAAGSAVKKLRQPVQVDINLLHHYSAKVYNPGSLISGELAIVTDRDVDVDAIHVAFVGKSVVEFDEMPSPTVTTHNFLKLDMPVHDDAYPINGVFRAGLTYNVPFKFVVPSQLLTTACKHPVNSDYIANHHMHLPPTFGGNLNDMGSAAARIRYSVRATVSCGDSSSRLFEASLPINILSSVSEEPPMIDVNLRPWYKLQKTKVVRKNMLAKPLGKITAVASQATPYRLGADGRSASLATSTINLTFEQTKHNSPLPELESVSASVRAYTSYSRMPMAGLPEDRWGVNTYNKSVSVNATPVSESAWTLNPPSHDAESASSLYTQNLEVAFDLPVDQKSFPPTFHTCLMSRMYAIEVKLCIGGEKMSLSLPVQVMVAAEHGNAENDDVLPSFYESMRAASF